jgi:hypothetical protein
MAVILPEEDAETNNFPFLVKIPMELTRIWMFPLSSNGLLLLHLENCTITIYLLLNRNSTVMPLPTEILLNIAERLDDAEMNALAWVGSINRRVCIQ